MRGRERHGGLAGWLIRFWRDRGGAISPMMVMALVPLIGAMAMGTEATNWWLLQRQAQNAADSAAIAAANAGSVNGLKGDSGNPCTVTGDWCNEALGAATKYGFVNGTDSTQVVAQEGTGTKFCPTAALNGICFLVSIKRTLPVTLLSVVGFKGSDGKGNQTITATATAYSTGGSSTDTNFCVVALGTQPTKDFTVNGGPSAQLPNCSIGSNGGTICNGGSIEKLDFSYGAPGDQNATCAPNPADDIPLRTPITDPYTSQATEIPTNPCGSTASSFPGTTISGTPAWSGTQKIFCGTVQLSADTTVGAAGTPTIMVIEDGALDLKGHTLTATNATIVFTGPSVSGFTPVQIIEDTSGGSKGTLNLTAPSGTWDGATSNWTGFAIYQDPSLTDTKVSGNTFSLDITFPGTNPTFAINGLVYAPKAAVTVSGDIDDGNLCLGFLVDTFIINGKGQIIEQNNCPLVGLNSSNEGFLAGQVLLVK
jgi:Flp pilus assembly protein TadG